MFHLITGGSGSGKSEYAEQKLMEYASHSKRNKKRYYIATMMPFGKETEEKIARHRRLRAGKGFETIECYTDLKKAAEVLQTKETGSVLLECMSNLLANEMFTEEGIRDEKEMVDKILKDISSLIEQTADGVIVSNNIFEDGENYDDAMASYIKALGGINQALAAMADEVIEVVVGIPVTLKSQQEESESGQICEK